MMGLLIKDIKLLKNQMRFFVIIFLMAVILMTTTENPFIFVSYVVFVFSMFSLSVISYDEYDNGFSYLFTMPFSRKKYVLEKYLFTFFLVITSGVVSCMVLMIYAVLWNPGIDILELIIVAPAYMLSIFVVLSIMLPLQFKFGSEKSRIALLIVVAVILGSGFLLLKLIPEDSMALERVLYTLGSIHPAILLAAGAVICALMIGISCSASIGIMKRKEF